MFLLAAVLSEKTVTVLRNIDPDLHLEKGEDHPEQVAFRFIRRHFDRHQQLPSLGVLAENTGVVLPEVDERVEYYFGRVRERALTTRILEPYNELQEALQSPKKSMDQLTAAIDKMYETKSRFLDAGSGMETSASLVHEIRSEFNMRRMNSHILRGITTGYEELDEQMDGYNAGDLVVWVGRPGRSKSWFLLKQCHAAWVAGYKPLYVSMEMGGIQNMRRIIGIQTGINPNFIKRGEIQTLALPGFNAQLDELLEQRPLHMVTANFSRTVDQIANFVTVHRPDIVYIDAGYLLTPRKKRFGSGGRRESISDVIEELKELAANSGIPFVITVQFNRQAEHRRRGEAATGFNPIAHLSLAEIGETDVIGQTATHVLGIEYPPAPCTINSHRVFGFLKGREGESGWFLTRFMENLSSPVNLDIVPRSDPIYEAIAEHARRAGANSRNPRDVPPNQRSNLMRINRAA